MAVLGRHTRVAAAAAVVAAAAVAGLLVHGEAGSRRAGGAIVGRAAPRFAALAGLRGHAVLLTFLDTQAQARAGNDPSRAQISFLKSMETQNQAAGLRTVIVDTGDATRDDLVNFTYDWALPRSIAVAGDPHGSLAWAYGVAKVPTTLLIDRRGVVRRRWDGFAPAAELDFAVRPLVGRREPGS
jgi:hypothetical protein